MSEGNFNASVENGVSDDAPAESTQEQKQPTQESAEPKGSANAEQEKGSQPQGSKDLRNATDVKEGKPDAQGNRMFTVKVDGEEMEVTERELLQGYQLRKASDKRFQEGMQARKQAEEFIRLLKTDPKKVLSHPSIGLDLKKFAEDYLMEQLQDEMLSPEERKMKEYQQKLAKYEEAEKKRREEQEAKQQKEVQEKYAKEYHQQIIGALENSGLPKTEYTVQRMIHYMHSALKKGYEMKASDVTDLVRQDYINDSKQLFSGLDADALESILGSDIAKKLRKAELNKLKNPHNNLKEPAMVKGKNRKQAKKKGLSKDEWRARLDSLKD